MRITKAQIGVGALVAVAAAGVAYTRRPQPLVVDVATVTRGPLETTIDADGRTRVRERYTIVAPVAGRVERITKVEGTLIRAGEIAVRVRPLPLDSTAAAQARARIEAADAVVLQAAALARTAEAELLQRERELSRAQRLAEAGGVAPRVVEECELARISAQEASRASAERSRAAEADARQAKAVLLGQLGGSAAVVVVRAPSSGRVLRVPERSERIVAAGTPLMEVGDPTSLEIVVDVLSSDGATIHPGDRVRLGEWVASGDAGEHADRFAGRVREIEPAAFTKVSALGVEEQRVNVIVDVDTVPPMVGDGFRVEASIIVWSAPAAIAVPRSALLQSSGQGGATGWNAFVVENGRVETRAVRVGHAGGAAAEALGGLTAGEMVVLFPSDRLTPGARVKVRKL